ncbi:uncharacterized protein A1O9_06359 [Exophiala aquamarina CBS 119918]|uniref:Uncharacterized protein n=1 Tax=Exophiala aquamarina CBS 119918 TaxID=1182545 RepID=A0A072PGK5_9EURO|nr:uncharacterized protein A1O9_06359 [Exophiala aquamarina CBS 119918]KEF58433.1 hypothetical protein A1O9_06359 [Exophiala aquamarina CBS 119918]
MSALDPTAPSQPGQQTGLNQLQNPASKTDKEETTARDTSNTSSTTMDHRSPHDIPSQHGETARPSALGAGDTGPLEEKRIPESDAQNYSKGDSNLEGEQMRMAGEGEVARAVRSGGGGGHAEEGSLTGDINRQEKEHAQALHERGEPTGKELDEEEHEDWTGKKADIAEALGQEDHQRPPVVLAAEE